MKKLLVGGIAAAAFCSTPALAADLPTKAPVYKAAPAAAPVFSWNGCYVGGNIGGAWSGKSFTDESGEFQTIGESDGHATAKGFVGGGQIGCDYQISSNWVVGFQGMWDAAGINGSDPIPNQAAPNYFKIKIDSFGTATGRIGYLLNPASLLYLNAGIGWVNDQYHTQCNFGYCVSHAESASGTRTGFDLGGGWEYKFDPKWSLFVAYDHIFLGNKSTTFHIDDGTTYEIRIRQDFDKILVGLNYRFGDMGKAPVVAKY